MSRPAWGKRARREPAAGRLLRATSHSTRSILGQPLGESLREALQRRLCCRVLHPLQLRVTDNVHTMLSFSRRGSVLEVRLHHMFLLAPEPVVEALARYIRGADPLASNVLDRFIQQNRRTIRRVPPHVRRSRMRLRTAGRFHDLGAIFRELDARYFGGVDCAITWGTAPRARLPRKSIKLGSYSADARLIRIHPALDQAEVPRFFVAWIVFHEMLHHVHGISRRGGRRCVHTPEFCADERSYPDYERAREWEREHLDLLLWWTPPPRAESGAVQSRASARTKIARASGIWREGTSAAR